MGATTNKKNLDAGLYSNCPYSIQRRLVCITVEAKPEFQRIQDGIFCGVDSTLVRNHYTDVDGNYNPPMVDDIWTVTIERAVKPAELSSVARYNPITYNGKLMVDISMAECIQWAIDDFQAHRLNQESILESMKLRERDIQLCPHKGCKHLKGNCPYHIEPQFGREILKSSWKLWYASDKYRKVDKLYDRIDKDVSNFLYERGMDFLDKWDWIKVVPAPILDHKDAPRILKLLYAERLKRDYKVALRGAFCLLFLEILMCFLTFNNELAWFFTFLLLIETALYLRNLVEHVEQNLYEDLKERNMEIAPMLKRHRDKYAKYICGVSIGIAALYGLAKAYRAYRSEDPHGSLEPKTKEEVQTRDSEVNVWTQVVPRDLPITDISRRMSAEQLSNVVKKCLVYGSIHLDNENAMVNGLMLSSNVMLVPDHYFEQYGDILNCTFRKRNPEASGGKFVAKLCKSASHLISDS